MHRMNKESFLSLLKLKLSNLEESEIKDIIDEYSDYIDQKVQDGLSEEEAVASFGDINELVSDINQAYHINQDDSLAHKTGILITDIINYSIRFFKTIFADFNVEGTSKFVVFLVVALIIIAVAKLPLFIIKTIIIVIFDIIFPSFLSTIANFIVSIIFGMLHLLIAITVLFSVYNAAKSKEPLNVENIIKPSIKSNIAKFKELNKRADDSYQNTMKEQMKQDLQVENKNVEILSDYQEKKEEKVTTSIAKDISIRILVFIIRFFTLIFLSPFLVLFLSTILLFAGLLFLLTKGIFFIGFTMLTVGAMGLLYLIITGIYRTIFQTKKGVHRHWLFLSAAMFALLATGVFSSAYELSQFDQASVSFVSQYVPVNTLTKTIKINPKQSVYFTRPIQVSYDDTLNDEMQISVNAILGRSIHFEQTKQFQQVYIENDINMKHTKEFANLLIACFKYRKNVYREQETFQVVLPSAYKDIYTISEQSLIIK